MTGERSRYLDILRGVAILGILPVNIAFMALPVERATSDGDLAAGVDLSAAIATRLLAEYKFVTLFSVLFGAGLVLLRERSTAGTLVRRLLVLWVFGALHAVLLFFGDILCYYALLGLIAVWAWRCRAASLAWTGAVLIALPAVVLLVAIAALGALGEPSWAPELFAPPPSPPRPVPAPRSWGEFGQGLMEWSPAFQEAVFRGGTFLQASALRALMWACGALVLGPYWGWRTLGLFLIGMALARSGWFLRPAEHRDRFRRLASAGFGLGLPLEIAGAFVNSDAMVPALSGELLHYVGSLGMAAGYAGGVGLLVGRLPRVLEQAGRAALTNYIAHSAVAMILFTGAGLGWYGRLGHASLLGVVAAVWAFNLALSALWMSRFRLGPLEWLWRSATSLSLHPLRGR